MDFMVTEIFRSIQGESSFAGLPCVFVRLAGCNLHCRYCDSRHALTGGEPMSLFDIMDAVSSFEFNLVEITGGEPLVQEGTTSLIASLLERGNQVLVETNGSLDIGVIPDGAVRIMDIKCPSSGECDRVLWENIWKLRPDDEVKFVISDRHDYEWARGIVKERFGRSKIKVLFSTVFGEIPPRNVVKWILEDKLNVRFQLQLHKYIWPHDMQGV